VRKHIRSNKQSRILFRNCRYCTLFDDKKLFRTFCTELFPPGNNARQTMESALHVPSPFIVRKVWIWIACKFQKLYYLYAREEEFILNKITLSRRVRDSCDPSLVRDEAGPLSSQVLNVRETSNHVVRRVVIVRRIVQRDVELIESRRVARASRSPKDVILIWF